MDATTLVLSDVGQERMVATDEMIKEYAHNGKNIKKATSSKHEFLRMACYFTTSGSGKLINMTIKFKKCLEPKTAKGTRDDPPHFHRFESNLIKNIHQEDEITETKRNNSQSHLDEESNDPDDEEEIVGFSW